MPRIIFIFAIVLSSIYVASSDFDTCRDDLDSLRRRAADASDAAGDAHSKAEDYDECKDYPETHDLLGDGCRSKRSDYESAVSDLESKMDDVDRRLRDVQSSCGYDFTLNRLSSTDAATRYLDAANRRLCASYKRFRTLLSRQQVFQSCLTNQSADWCNACLGP